MASALCGRRASALSGKWAACWAGGARQAAFGARSAASLASLVHGHAVASPSKPALIAPQQSLSWSYAELSQRAGAAAGRLAQLGVGKGDVVVTDLPNSAENLVLQVALSHLGAAAATVKDAKALAALAEATSLKGAVTHEGEGATDLLAKAKLPLPAQVMPELDGSLGPLGAEGGPSAPEPVKLDDGAPLAYWSSTKPLSLGEAMSMGGAAQAKLGLGPSDRVLVTITLCHAFGIGSAVGGALLSGATVVLPGSSGIRGCGSPSQRAQVTLEVLESQKCSVFFADVHTLKALPPPGSADLSALRTGVCKVGSGADFLDHVTEAKIGPDGEMRPLEYAGVRILAMGKQ